MATDFETSRREVAGRDMTITSWCDTASHTRSASAPTCCHMLLADGPANGRAPSRAEAIARVVRDLASQLGRQAQD